MTQDTNIENLIINKLTKAQYESIANPDPAQLYFITDEVISSSDVVNALGYTPENVANKTTTLSSSSTDTQYPSAKAVYDQIANIDTLPSQTGQSGKFLTTDGTDASWGNLPVTTDLNGKANVSADNFNATGTTYLSGLGMPSGRYIDLTLGASGTKYTAPANGWVSFCVEGGENGLFGLNNRTIIDSARKYIFSPFSTFIQAPVKGVTYRIFMPIMKNSEFSIEFYGSTTPQWLVFIYAQGSESEAQ